MHLVPAVMEVPPMATVDPMVTGTSPMPVPVMGDGLGVTRVSRTGRRAGQSGAGGGANARNDETY
jgi:hypothetical protein